MVALNFLPENSNPIQQIERETPADRSQPSFRALLGPRIVFTR